jgi:hypothetical protein
MFTGLECCYLSMTSLQGPVIIAASGRRATCLPFKRVWRQTLAVERLFAASSVDAGVYRASSLVDINADAGSRFRRTWR